MAVKELLAELQEAADLVEKSKTYKTDVEELTKSRNDLEAEVKALQLRKEATEQSFKDMEKTMRKQLDDVRRVVDEDLTKVRLYHDDERKRIAEMTEEMQTKRIEAEKMLEGVMKQIDGAQKKLDAILKKRDEAAQKALSDLQKV